MTNRKFGYIALVGAPNTGKSTLMNRLMGTKVSIVTHKVQTTRARIIGVCVHDTAQIVFVDTPGIFAPKRRIERAMVTAAWGSAADADIIALLVDTSQNLADHGQPLVSKLKGTHQKAVLVLNKIDLIPRELLLSLSEQWNATGVFKETFMISALKGDGIDDLIPKFATMVPDGPWHYPEDHLTDMNERLFSAEITREKLFLKLHQELPYSLTVETEGWEERADGSVKVDQVIYVERQSQRAIVLGKGGKQIKQIGAIARQELESLMERRVHLFLFVKVREKWRDDPERYREMGLEFSD